jgi:TRIAD3 protein (E3 ubiquitin-protein ligase RNF216)
MASITRLVSPRALEQIRQNEHSQKGWDRGLEGGESYFQCPECMQTWIAAGEFSDCPQCHATICQVCWNAVESQDCHICERHDDVDEAMSEAVIRKCPRCRIRFIKEENGRNHVMCPRCHGHICYCCGKMFAGENIYMEHFGVSCPVASQIGELHDKRADEAAQAFWERHADVDASGSGI